jgi:hypothetical protein
VIEREQMSGKNSRVLKVAGLSFVGFCAVSMAADRAALSPAVSQLAGFCGAFLGALAARRTRAKPEVAESPSSHGSSRVAGLPPEKQNRETPPEPSPEQPPLNQ